MPDGRIVIEMTGEEAKFFAACTNAARGLSYVENGVVKVGEKSRKTMKDEEDLARTAKKVYEDTRTPMEQHQARMQRIAELNQKGKIDADAYERAASASYAKMEKALGKTGDEAKKTGEELKNAGKKGEEAFGSQAVSMAKGFLAALGIDAGIGGAVRLIKAEWEAVIKVQERAMEASLPVADAQRKFRGAAGFTSLEEAEAFDAKIEDVSKATGVMSKDLYLDAAPAMKERGVLSKEQTMSAVKMGAKLFPADSEDRRQFIKSTMGVQEATGWSGEKAGAAILVGSQRAGMAFPSMAPILNALPREDPRKVMAVAQALQASSEMDPTKMILGVYSGLAKGIQTHSAEQVEVEKKKIDDELSQAKEATKLAALQDPEYRKRREEITVKKARMGQHRGPVNPQEAAKRDLQMMDLADQESQALQDAERRAETSPEFQGKLAKLAEREKKLKDRTKLGDNFDEQLAYVRAHPEIADELIEGMGLKGKKPKEYARQFLTGTGAAAEHYQKTLSSQITDEEVKAAIKTQDDVMGGGPLQATATFSRGTKAAAARIESSPEMQPQAHMAIIARNFKSILQDVGEYSLVSSLQELGVRLSDDQVQTARDKLVAKQKELRGPKERLGIGQNVPWVYDVLSVLPGWLGSGGTVGPATAGELSQANQLQEVIDCLNTMNTSVKEMNTSVKENTTDRRDNRRQSPTLGKVNQKN